MSKIQGKQVADGTITQNLLNLGTPNSGDTTSGATVGFVETYVSSLSGSTVIGPAEDGEYVDGIFTDFTEDTRIGVAVDRFNEMFKLLAPTPPSNSWVGTFSNLNITSTEYSALALGTTTPVVNNITIDTTPDYAITDNVGIEAAAKALPSGAATLTFEMSDTSGILETEVINSGSTGDAVGVIQYTVADPYSTQGKIGFWTGITAFSVSGTISSPITPSASQRTLTFTYPGSGTLTYNYYVDDAVTPSVGTVSATLPSMTRYISGVPSLAAGASITNIGFSVTNAVSYFYNNSFYDLTGTLIVSDTNNPPTTTPTTHGETVTESGLGATVTSSSVFDDDSFQFTVTARSANGSSGSANFSSGTYRIDLVSNETIRKTSGSGNYPSTGWGDTFDSAQVLNDGNAYDEEMMLKNGIYQYPNTNYTTYGGPDYSTNITGTRWVTLVLTSFAGHSAFYLDFVGSTGISGNPYGTSGLLVQVKISGGTGSTYWADGNAAYSTGTNPGFDSQGLGAVVVGSSTATHRYITFGTIPYTGPIIVRVGLTGTGITFTNLTATLV